VAADEWPADRMFESALWRALFVARPQTYQRTISLRLNQHSIDFFMRSSTPRENLGYFAFGSAFNSYFA
jgi:hypothetical protein